MFKYLILYVFLSPLCSSLQSLDEPQIKSKVTLTITATPSTRVIPTTTKVVTPAAQSSTTTASGINPGAVQSSPSVNTAAGPSSLSRFAPLCPHWNLLPWIPVTSDPSGYKWQFPPGTYVPQQGIGFNMMFLIWCGFDIPAKDTDSGVTDLDKSGAPVTLEECIYQCIHFNEAVNSRTCTAVSLDANGLCFIKSTNSFIDGVSHNLSTTRKGEASAILLPGSYSANGTWFHGLKI